MSLVMTLLNKLLFAIVIYVIKMKIVLCKYFKTSPIISPLQMLTLKYVTVCQEKL